MEEWRRERLRRMGGECKSEDKRYIHTCNLYTYIHKSIHTSTFARHCEKHLMVTMKYVHLHTYVRTYVRIYSTYLF